MVLEHQRQPVRGGAFFLHHRAHRFEIAPHACAVHVETQIGLGPVVVIDPALGGPQPARDVVDAGGVEPLLHEALGRRGQQFDIAHAVIACSRHPPV
ncbi:hypothetical protein G6F59_015627 [Rhizopus arrhizus]|nr:hypothetical protein G6F59_015627 [Rhizopus arrhizus]